MSTRLIHALSPFERMAGQFRDGSATPRDYLERCLQAIDEAEPTVKAFVYLDTDAARAQADASTRRYREGKALSPIDGMPIGVKDIIDTCDMPTQMNSPLFEGRRPRLDAASVRAARDGGAVLVGKTVTTEFAIGRSGPTVNPHNPAHTPGGSSSGSAAGVAAGMMAAAFGTQTNGSIIRPAGFCGVVGYKPTIGMLSTEGVHALSRTNDHLGVIAGSVGDAWLLARWVSEHAPQKGLPGLSGPFALGLAVRPSRVAVLRTDGFQELDAPCMAALERKIDALRDAGVDILEPAGHEGLAQLVEVLRDVPDRSLEVVAYEMQWPFRQYLEQAPEKFGPRIPKLMEQAAGISRERYRDLLRLRESLRARVMALTDEFDAFVLPASSSPAPAGLSYTGSRTLLTYASFLGLPAFTLPVMTVDGLPYGLQVLGFPDADWRLACHARWLQEQATRS